MGVLFFGGVLFGIILGRFFKVLILVPVCGLGVLLTTLRALELQHTLLFLLAEILVVVSSLQIGYIISAISRTTPIAISDRKRTWSQAASAAWRSVHMR